MLPTNKNWAAGERTRGDAGLDVGACDLHGVRILVDPAVEHKKCGEWHMQFVHRRVIPDKVVHKKANDSSHDGAHGQVGHEQARRHLNSKIERFALY